MLLFGIVINRPDTVNTREPIFVLSARISAFLFFVTKVVKDISITSKNARAISVRAGENAAGFIAITDYIEELFNETISRSTAINNIGIKISQLSIELEKSNDIKRDMQWVCTRATDAAHISSIEPLITENNTNIQRINKEFKLLLRKLESELEVSRKQIRSADVLVSNVRIESTKVGNFEEAFNIIAEDLQEAANEIRTKLKAADALLIKAIKQHYESN